VWAEGLAAGALTTSALVGYVVVTELGKCNLGLHARKRRAKAAVDATAKRQMCITAPIRLEAIGVRETRWVTLGCREREHHQSAPGNHRFCHRNVRPDRRDRGTARHHVGTWCDGSEPDPQRA
jgi:hypothetical protein